MRLPFGCKSGSTECHLDFELFDPDDRYNCYDSSIAAIHSNTCGGRIEGSTSLSNKLVNIESHVTNITVTTKTNNRYYMRNEFTVELRTNAVGNTKDFWKFFKTTIKVSDYSLLILIKYGLYIHCTWLKKSCCFTFVMILSTLARLKTEWACVSPRFGPFK